MKQKESRGKLENKRKPIESGWRLREQERSLKELRGRELRAKDLKGRESKLKDGRLRDRRDRD